ncbi:MAG: response regulator transcription factor, partial [Deltaproteobacteria bacterium]
MSVPDIHLLIVDDDERIRGLLQKYLAKNGYFVTTARDAAHARRILSGLAFDLIILDVMMPGEDGITFARDLRTESDTPILMLTARSETDQKIAGFEAGVDDYLAKPFEPKELLLRINAILRRMPALEPTRATPTVLSMGHVRYDVARGKLLAGDKPLRLTATETQLMRIFAAAPNAPFSRRDLVEKLG